MENNNSIEAAKLLLAKEEIEWKFEGIYPK